MSRTLSSVSVRLRIARLVGEPDAGGAAPVVDADVGAVGGCVVIGAARLEPVVAARGIDELDRAHRGVEVARTARAVLRVERRIAADEVVAAEDRAAGEVLRERKVALRLRAIVAAGDVT